MQTNDFQNIADQCLNRVADWLEAFDPDEVDFATTDGVVTIEFPDGIKYILNRQSAADQMWYAAGARAWHYDQAGASWKCDKDGHDLFERIGETISEKIGRTVRIDS